MKNTSSVNLSSSDKKWLFWGCFIALVATSFAFVIRNLIIGDLGQEFNLSETQKGEILGVGLWPFGVSIMLFSLICDRIGYGTAMIFAFICHLAAAILTITAAGYWMLYLGTFLVAFGNGTVEAVINPVIATIYPKEKTKWLNILHAGWPGGMVLGGIIIVLVLGPEMDWRWKVGLIFIPMMFYGAILFKCKFPIQERVRAGVSYKNMLREAGIIGALLVVTLFIAEIVRVTSMPPWLGISIGAILVIGYGLYVKSLGQPLFVFLLIIMVPLATTELGTDSWITELMENVMGDFGMHPGWVIVYTALIMMILRFSAGPIVHRLKPLGLLAFCSALAIIGLLFLSKAAGILIFVAATVYGIGKSFFWPTMLGVVSERFPKGGALTLNMISAVAMLSVGIIGAEFIGKIQDKNLEAKLLKENKVMYEQVIGEEKSSVLGKYKALDKAKMKKLSEEGQNKIKAYKTEVKKDTLSTIAIFPAFMLICYLILIMYFKSKGGYKPVELES